MRRGSRGKNMLPVVPTVGERSLSLGRPEIEIVVSEDGASPMTFVLPPYDDLAEIESFQGGNFSIRDFSDERSLARESFASEWNSLRSKYERYSSSPTYLNRLAGLAGMSGDFKSAEKYLIEATKLSSDEFLGNRLVETYLAAHEVAHAERMLGEKDLSTNLYANLRLAALYVQRKDIRSAAIRVAKALEINPLDFGARLFDGALKIWQGDYARAILSFRVASEKRPNSASLHANIAVAYLKMGRLEKAFQALKLAVAIDPLSSNAVLLLADVAHTLGCSEDAVPALRFFVRFEQKSSSIWARFARALLHINQPSEAIAALKRQASVEESPEVWNNLGVAYSVAQDNRKALESFKRSMELTERDDDFGFCFACTNAAIAFAKTASPKQVVTFIDDAVTTSNRHIFSSHRELYSIFIVKLQCLMRLGKVAQAVDFGEAVLTLDNALPELTIKVASSLLALYAINFPESPRLAVLADEFYAMAIQGGVQDETTRILLMNNLAYVFVEGGDMSRAEMCMQLISSAIHKSPYPTATSGLLQLRKGNIDRAEMLYREALVLCSSRGDIARIRQKWNLEFGRSKMGLEPRIAVRLLKRAAEEREGETAISEQAKKLITRIALS